MATVTPKKPFGRALTDFGELSTAEQAVLEACRIGEEASISDKLPTAKTVANAVRASFVRFLVLGGDEGAPVHERGVQMRGGWMTEELDLASLTVRSPIFLTNCVVQEIYANWALLPLLSLSGSLIEGAFSGDGMQCAASVFLDEGFQAKGTVRLVGGSIGGNFACARSFFENIDASLICDGIKISGDLLLSGDFRASGRVSFIGASVSGDVDCSLGNFRAALNLDRMIVGGAFFVRGLTGVGGQLGLSDMSCTTLDDDYDSWQKVNGGLVLDGFTYRRFDADKSLVSAASRIAWLDLQPSVDLNDEFKPQPWEQLINVLRAMGHPRAAAEVAIAKQDRLRRARRISRLAKPFHWLYGRLIGYGYKPARLMAILIGVWLASGVLFEIAERANLIVVDNSGSCNSHIPAAAFVPFMYSLDLLLPINFGYRGHWAVALVDAKGDLLFWGQCLQYLCWMEIGFGWAASLLLVGVLGNLIKKD